MAMEDLHDAARRVHELQETAKGTVRPEEFDTLSEAVLLIVAELSYFDERLQMLEQGPSNSN